MSNRAAFSKNEDAQAGVRGFATVAYCTTDLKILNKLSLPFSFL